MKLKVSVVSDAHLFRTPDNKYWCNTAMHGYLFWKRYLDVFEEVNVVARVKDIGFDELKKNKYISADGKGVFIKALPFIRGIKGYALHYHKMNLACKKISYDADCAIFRVPSIPAYLFLKEYKKRKKPFAAEVVIDPEDEYSSLPLMKYVSVQALKKCCKNANGVSYVTQFYLQSKYPSRHSLEKRNKNYFESYYSSIDLSKEFFYFDRIYKKQIEELNIIHVANSINNENKGHHVLLEIVSRLKKMNIIANITFIGNGDLIKKYILEAEDLGISNPVMFTGYVSSKTEIRNYLISSDIFVFPTRAEGLPRALIEAMATGLPCLSSKVDGIPELLDDEYMFLPDDIDGYVRKIAELLNNPHELEIMGRKNIKKAREYESEKLRERRVEFYNKLRAVAED